MEKDSQFLAALADNLQEALYSLQRLGRAVDPFGQDVKTIARLRAIAQYMRETEEGYYECLRSS